MNKTLVILIGFLFPVYALSQQTHSLSGTISNANGEKIEAATVFIAGSKRLLSSSNSGEFKFTNLPVGTYQIVINHIGYEPRVEDVVLNNASVTIQVVLEEKVISLNTVVVGSDSQRKSFLKTFLKYFMGESQNAKSCKLLNPDIIDFSTEKALVKASTDDFMVIENQRLGYRIKYLLRNFQYDKKLETTIYEGESIFEDMNGSPEEQKKWAERRKEAYQSSLMHYLRALFDNTTRNEGFLTYAITSPGFPLVIDPNPLNTEQIIKHVDSNFFEFTYKKRLYIIYDPKKAAKEDAYMDKHMILDNLDLNGSVLLLNARVGRNGSYANYKDILIQGFWGTKRIGDQLPIEYQPEISK